MDIRKGSNHAGRNDALAARPIDTGKMVGIGEIFIEQTNLSPFTVTHQKLN